MGSNIKINLLDPQTLGLLRQLEAMKLLEIVDMEFPSQPEVAPIEGKKWAGVISDDTADKMLEHVANSREEWS